MRLILLLLLCWPVLGWPQRNPKGLPSSKADQKRSENPALDHFLARSPEYKALISQLEIDQKTLQSQTEKCNDAQRQHGDLENACGRALSDAEARFVADQELELRFRQAAASILALLEASPKASDRLEKAANAFMAGKVAAADKCLDEAEISREGEAALKLPASETSTRKLMQLANELFFKALFQLLDVQNPKRYEACVRLGKLSAHFAEVKENLMDLGAMLVGDGHTELAEPFFVMALKLRLSEEHTYLICERMGAYYIEQERYDDAESMYRRAITAILKITQKETDEAKAVYADKVIDLGKCLVYQKKFEEANKQFLKAQAVLDELDSEEIETARLSVKRCWQQAWLYEQDTTLGHALETYAQAIQIAEGMSRADLETQQYMLFQAVKLYAEVCARYGEDQKSSASYTRAYQILDRLAKDHLQTLGPDMVWLLLAQIAVEERLGHDEAVEKLYLKAIDMGARLKRNGFADQVVEEQWAVNQLNLGNNYRSAGRLEEGERLYKSGWPTFKRIAERDLPTNRRRLCRAVLNFALLERDFEHYRWADSLFQQSIALAEVGRKTEPDVFEPLLADALLHYGIQCYQLQQWADAEMHLKRSVELFQAVEQRAPETESYNLLWSLVVYADCLVEAKKADEAEKWLKIALERVQQREERYPELQGSNFIWVWQNLADCKKAQKQYDEALDYAKRSLNKRLEISHLHHDSLTVQLGMAQNDVGFFAQIAGKFAESQKYYGEALETFRQLTQAGEGEVWEEYLRTYSNLNVLDDSLDQRHDYAGATAIQRLRLASVQALPASVAERDSLTGVSNGALAWALLFEQKYDEAHACSKKGLELAPDQNWIRTNLGHAYLLRGDWDNALIVYQAYLDHSPTKEDARKSLTTDWDDLEAAKVIPPLMQLQVGRARAWLETR